MKRSSVLSWDQYFMSMAHLAAFRSKDPNTQVGACIVNRQKRVVGLGYNGFPKGCSDDTYSWDRTGDFLETKYPYVVHAELNAILNSIQNLEAAPSMSRSFPATSVPRLSSSPGLPGSSMNRINTAGAMKISPASTCLMMPAWNISRCPNTSTSALKSRI